MLRQGRSSVGGQIRVKRLSAIVLLSVATLLLAATSHGASLSYNSAATEALDNNDIWAQCRVIVYDGGPFVEVDDSARLLHANYVQPAAAHSWGGGANASPSQEDLSVSGHSFLTVDSEGPATVKVRVSNNARVLAENANQNSRQGDAASGTNFLLVFGMNDLVPGELYHLDYDWLAHASADSLAEPSLGTSGSEGRMFVSLIGPNLASLGPSLTIFDEYVYPVQGPIQPVNTSGSSSHSFVAPDTHVDMFVVISSRSVVSLSFNPTTVDNVATNFYGETRFTLHQVAEPNSITLLVIGCLLLATVVRLHSR